MFRLCIVQCCSGCVAAMASRADRSETIRCDLCDALVTRGNLSRHRRAAHPTLVVQTTAQRATPLRAVPTTQSTAVPAAASRRASPTSSHPRSDSCESLRSNASTSSALLTMEAARNLLDQHHLTSERDLLQHLHLHFPDIPEDQRRTLIMAAVAGAQRAASTYFMLESNCESQEPERRQLMRSAKNDLSYWNYGQLRILESSIRSLNRGRLLLSTLVPSRLLSTAVGPTPTWICFKPR